MELPSYCKLLHLIENLSNIFALLVTVKDSHRNAKRRINVNGLNDEALLPKVWLDREFHCKLTHTFVELLHKLHQGL